MLVFTFEQVKVFGITAAIFTIFYCILVFKKGANNRNSNYNKCR